MNDTQRRQLGSRLAVGHARNVARQERGAVNRDLHDWALAITTLAIALTMLLAMI